MKGHCSLLPLNEQLFAEVQTESWEPITPGGHCFSVPRLSRSPAEVLRVPEQPANSIFSFACGGGGAFVWPSSFTVVQTPSAGGVSEETTAPVVLHLLNCTGQTNVQALC